MDSKEARSFFNDVAFVHFPALQSWLSQTVESPLKTIDAWQMTLHDVTFAEALSVVHRWTKDELPRLQGFELPDFALHLKAVVMRDRADRKRAIIDGINRDREPDAKEYSHVSIRPYIARVFESAEAFKAGKITIEQHKANTDAVLADHDRAYKQTRCGNG